MSRKSTRRGDAQKSPSKMRALERRPHDLPNPTLALSEIRHLLGPSWILEGEDPRIYEELLTRVGDAVRPNDVIDWLWVRDLVVLTWQCYRLTRRGQSILRLANRDAIERFLRQIIPKPDPYSTFDEHGLVKMPAKTPRDVVDDLATDWFSGDKKAVKYVDDLLEKAGLSLEDITGLALSSAASELNEIDRQNEALQRRRDEILRQIERRRGGWARLVDRESEEIIEAEYQELAAEPAPG